MWQPLLAKRTSPCQHPSYHQVIKSWKGRRQRRWTCEELCVLLETHVFCLALALKMPSRLLGANYCTKSLSGVPLHSRNLSPRWLMICKAAGCMPVDSANLLRKLRKCAAVTSALLALLSSAGSGNIITSCPPISNHMHTSHSSSPRVRST